MSIEVVRPVASRDLDDPGEVADLVRRFYADVVQDDLLGPMFDEVAQVDWSEHLPKLTAFWCRALFGTAGYSGNPFHAHQVVHTKRAITSRHFERWLELFEETIDVGWVGPNAEKLKAIANNVARVHGQQLGSLPGSIATASSPRTVTPADTSEGERR